MKRDNVNYLLVGSFVLAMGVVLFYALFRITGHSAKGELYHTHFANVAGIKIGSVVTFEGYEVGNVLQIEPVTRDNRTAYRLTLNIRKPLRVPRDSRAMIATPGLLAAPLVEIKEGRASEAIASGGEIPAGPSANLMDSVATLANDLGRLTETSVKPLLEQISRRVETVGDSLDKNLPATLSSLKTTAQRAEVLFSPENQLQWSGLLKNANAASADLLKLSRELHSVRNEVEGLVKDTRSIINSSGEDLQLSLKRADSVLYQLESAGRHLNEFSRNIRENPSALLQSKPPADAAGEVP